MILVVIKNVVTSYLMRDSIVQVNLKAFAASSFGRNHRVSQAIHSWLKTRLLVVLLGENREANMIRSYYGLKFIHFFPIPS